MRKYYFYYYFSNGQVMAAKIVEEGGKCVGPTPEYIEDCKWEITEDQFYNVGIFHLRGDYPYPF